MFNIEVKVTDHNGEVHYLTKQTAPVRQALPSGIGAVIHLPDRFVLGENAPLTLVHVGRGTWVPKRSPEIEYKMWKGIVWSENEIRSECPNFDVLSRGVG